MERVDTAALVVPVDDTVEFYNDTKTERRDDRDGVSMSIPKIGDVDKVMKQFGVAKRIIFEFHTRPHKSQKFLSSPPETTPEPTVAPKSLETVECTKQKLSKLCNPHSTGYGVSTEY